MRLPGSRRGAAAAFADAGRPDVSTPWREGSWCALDLELTGLNPRQDAIIAVGAVPVEDGRLILGKALYTLARTSRRSEHGAVLVHKLRVADLADAPPIEDVVERMLEVLVGRVPVFHTAAVERAFLRPLLRRHWLRLPDAADTEVLGRLWLRQRDGDAPAGLALATLAQVLRLPAESPHHALGDALTTAKAFIALASHLDAREPQTIGSLVHPAGSVDASRRFGPA
ncbi:MAG: 3'-5' exonuclease [Solirubrobacteraceae bacterium]